MSKKKSKKACCECCSNCIPIGEGDHVCDSENKSKMVIRDYTSTEDYLHCRGRKFKN